MIDFYKKANFYYIVIPLAAAVWAVLASTVFLNSANEKWDKIQLDAKESEKLIAKILLLDPDRLELHKEIEGIGKFDYNTVIGKFAIRHGVPESGYGLRATAEKRQKGVTTQGATLTINNIKVVPFTKFLSEILFLWPNLQCDSVTMTNQKTGPDAWKAEMKFKYTYKK